VIYVVESFADLMQASARLTAETVMSMSMPVESDPDPASVDRGRQRLVLWPQDRIINANWKLG
jgi:hypothetical protein